MDLEDLFKSEPQPRHKMDQNDFFKKTKVLLSKIYVSYVQAWQNRPLADSEYPEESICNKCTGCGTFIDNSDTKVCVQDNEQGYCFHPFFDYEQLGEDLENYLENIEELLSVEEAAISIKNAVSKNIVRYAWGNSKLKTWFITKNKTAFIPKGCKLIFIITGEITNEPLHTLDNYPNKGDVISDIDNLHIKVSDVSWV